jgi:hypothetical protein
MESGGTILLLGVKAARLPSMAAREAGTAAKSTRRTAGARTSGAWAEPKLLLLLLLLLLLPETPPFEMSDGDSGLNCSGLSRNGLLSAQGKTGKESRAQTKELKRKKKRCKVGTLGHRGQQHTNHDRLGCDIVPSAGSTPPCRVAR